MVYGIYAAASQHGPSGGTPIGLTFGIGGYAMMIFAGLLSLRKRFPIWRIGRAQTWMRGHLWLGLLSYPIILFHAAFHFGGLLSSVLMWLFTIVFVSGIMGAALQHYLPHVITTQVPMETIYDQIERIRQQLISEADNLMEVFSATPEMAMAMASEQSDTKVAMAAIRDMSEQNRDELNEIYQLQVRPYLYERGAHERGMAEPRKAAVLIQQMKTIAPTELHDMIDDLENICEEKRNLDRQTTMHRILHSWLLVHIPLSYAVLLLAAVHAVMALRY